MSAYSKGGRSLFFAEHIGRGGSINSTYEVLIEREATLNERLSGIEDRRVRQITLLIHPGFDDTRVVKLSPEEALELSNILKEAFRGTADEATS